MKRTENNKMQEQISTFCVFADTREQSLGIALDLCDMEEGWQVAYYGSVRVCEADLETEIINRGYIKASEIKKD